MLVAECLPTGAALRTGTLPLREQEERKSMNQKSCIEGEEQTKIPVPRTQHKAQTTLRLVQLPSSCVITLIVSRVPGLGRFENLPFMHDF